MSRIRKTGRAHWLCTGLALCGACRFNGSRDPIVLIEPDAAAHADDGGALDDDDRSALDGGALDSGAVQEPTDAARPADATADADTDPDADPEGGADDASTPGASCNPPSPPQICDPLAQTGCELLPLGLCTVDPMLENTGRCVPTALPPESGCRDDALGSSCPPGSGCNQGTCRSYCRCDAQCPTGECCTGTGGGVRFCGVCP